MGGLYHHHTIPVCATEHINSDGGALQKRLGACIGIVLGAYWYAVHGVLVSHGQHGATGLAWLVAHSAGLPGVGWD